MLFTGEYEYTIDAKQRLAIPADIRSRLNPDTDGRAFYLVPGANGALWMWPEKTFEEMAGAVDPSLLPPDEMMEFDEFLFSQAARLEIDKAGRVRLPERLLRLIDVESSVVILGVKDHLELRSPADWEARRRQQFAQQDAIMLRARGALEARRQSRRGPEE